MGVPPDTDMPDEGDVSGELPKTARALPAPGTPSQKEVDEHECSGHAVFRTWCRTCVQSRGVGQQHRPLPHDAEEEVAK
eukprot:3918873-Amphidinium_carterae.1